MVREGLYDKFTAGSHTIHEIDGSLRDKLQLATDYGIQYPDISYDYDTHGSFRNSHN